MITPNYNKIINGEDKRGNLLAQGGRDLLKQRGSIAVFSASWGDKSRCRRHVAAPRPESMEDVVMVIENQQPDKNDLKRKCNTSRYLVQLLRGNKLVILFVILMHLV